MSKEKPLNIPTLSFESKYRIIYKALLIRKVEEALLKLYATGELFGTIHTCIGQEFTGAVVSEFIKSGDAVFSNHRCHGHFLSITQNVYGLIAEIFGKNTGVCGGKGGSQHLFQDGFYSNGIQGGIVPVAAGLGLSKKLDESENISIVFIGDGTLGEGSLYETLNIASKWNLPLVIILENNLYAQSTPQIDVMAGNICARAEAFAIKTAQANTWHWENLFLTAEQLINYTRTYQLPCFLQINTYRLSAHSKGDDNRDVNEINYYKSIDPLNSLLMTESQEFAAMQTEIEHLIDQAIQSARDSQHNTNFLQALTPLRWHIITHDDEQKSIRFAHALNEAFVTIMRNNEKVYFIGEDVRSPYGGAFKISQNLSVLFPVRVLNTPISENTIVGIGTGLALAGYRPIVEIMFGDFITLAMDQIINHAAKFRYMYNDQVRVPLIIRTPMGGGRGYGPTHSQTLDRHLLGIPGLRVIAINNLIHPKIIYQTLLDTSEDPIIVIENKIMYTKFLRENPPEGFRYKFLNDTFSVLILEPDSLYVNLTIVAYGGLADMVVDILTELFLEHEIIAQFICPLQIYPYKIDNCLSFIKRSNFLIFIEEGQGFANFSTEIISQLHHSGNLENIKTERISAIDVPIPAAKVLENEVLLNKEKIIKTILAFLAKK